MIDPLRFTGKQGLPRLAPEAALFTSVVGSVRPSEPPAATVVNTIARLDTGLRFQIDVMVASIGRLRPPPPAPVTLQDLVRAARRRLNGEGLARRRTRLDDLRTRVLAVRTAIEALP